MSPFPSGKQRPEISWTLQRKSFTNLLAMKTHYLISAVLGLMILGAAPSSGASKSSATNANTRAKLDLYWGAGPATYSCYIKGDHRTLTCEFNSLGQKSRVKSVPTKEAWAKFWKAMDEVRLWEWQARYDNPNIMDGLVWSLEIVRGGRQANSGGRSGFPTFGKPGKADGVPSPLFITYQRAVEDLIGRKLWKE
jgi:hypothetical protein